MGGDNSIGTLFLLAAIGLFAYALIRGRRQQREVQNVQAGLTAGTEVMTSSGLYATVVAIDGDVVTLETAPGTTSRWDRRAVIRVVTPSGVQDDDEDADTTEGDTPPGRE